MEKQNIKKITILITLGILLIVGFTMFVFSGGVSDTFEEFIQNIASQKELDKDDIKDIIEVSLDNPPENVVLENIHSSDLNIYQVDIKGEDRPVFVIALR